MRPGRFFRREFEIASHHFAKLKSRRFTNKADDPSIYLELKRRVNGELVLDLEKSCSKIAKRRGESYIRTRILLEKGAFFPNVRAFIIS